MKLAIDSRLPLSHGGSIPVLGLGVYAMGPGRETVDAVARDEVFVTTKLWNDDHGYDAALAAFDASVSRLGLDTVDLYLIHWPVEGRRAESWRALERLLEYCRTSWDPTDVP